MVPPFPSEEEEEEEEPPPNAAPKRRPMDERKLDDEDPLGEEDFCFTLPSAEANPFFGFSDDVPDVGEVLGLAVKLGRRAAPVCAGKDDFFAGRFVGVVVAAKNK